MERIADAVLAALARPDVRHAIAGATLAGVVADLTVTLLLARRGALSLMGSLASRFRGPAGTVAAGLLHPLLMAAAATVLVLGATRRAWVASHWWLPGLLLGAGLVLLSLAVSRRAEPASPSRAATARAGLPLVATGLLVAAAAGLLLRAGSLTL